MYGSWLLTVYLMRCAIHGGYVQSLAAVLRCLSCGPSDFPRDKSSKVFEEEDPVGRIG